MAESPEWLVETQQLLGSIIQKPPLTEKLLSRPPFRFLHDVVFAVESATGFPAGLFSGDERDCKAIQSRDDKVLFLKKLIRCLQLATNEPVEANPLKIVAGRDADATNHMLQQLARAALNVNNINMPALIQSTLYPDGAATSSTPPPAAATAAAAPVEQEAPISVPVPVKQTPTPQMDPPQMEAPRQQQAPPPPQQKQEPQQVQGQDQLPHWMQRTIEVVGGLVDAPRMVPKYLARPPFRYVHDIFMNIYQKTGFPQDFYEEAEMDSASFTDSKSKVLFLRKVTKLYEHSAGQASPMDAKNVVAGKDAEQTNIFLVEFASLAIRFQGQSPNPVSSSNPTPQPDMQRAPSSQSSTGYQQERNVTPQEQQPMQRQPSAGRQRQSPATNERKENEMGDSRQQPVRAKAMPKLALGLEGDDDNSASRQVQPQRQQRPPSAAPSTRPRTARRAPPKLRSNVAKEEKDTVVHTPAASGVIAEGEQVEESSSESEEEEQEPVAGFGGAGAELNLEGGQHGKLVRDLLNAQKGAQQKKEEGVVKFGSIGKGNTKAFSGQQIQELRSQIQNVCQSVNPLGKCIDFVYEDVDQMNRELAQWKALLGENSRRLEEERAETERILSPMTEELSQLDKEIENMKLDIQQTKANILRNERRISKRLQAQLFS